MKNVVCVVDPGPAYQHKAMSIPVLVFSVPSQDRYRQVKEGPGETLMLYLTPFESDKIEQVAIERGFKGEELEEIDKRFSQIGGGGACVFRHSQVQGVYA